MKHFNKKGDASAPSEQTVSKGEEEINALLPDYGKYAFLKKSFLIKLNLLMFVVSLSSTNNGYDGSLLNGLQAMPKYNKYLGNPTGAVMGAINNGVVFGSLISFPFVSKICDYFGRRNTIIIGDVILIIGVILQSCSQNYAMFLVSRLVLGFGTNVSVVPSPTLMSELTYPSHRQVVTAVYNTCWYLGAIIGAWVTFGTRNVSGEWCWRIPSICMAFWPLVQLTFIFFVPESPRWLVSKGRTEEARSILMKYHADNNEEVGGALVDFEMAEISAAIQAEQMANNFSYLDFFKTPVKFWTPLESLLPMKN
ncbi:unnamed protein product [Ambrosiozyma monospora]|uniref:Unnamed protein product n=1 Tax=Ambrosiozyma monospora TaxID=43982 RepID=A0ACB5TDB3_AMBMO|nr:unnamed protein product [Ambrosiozyma monospora]